MTCFNLYHTLGKFSRRQFNTLLTLIRKQVLTLHAFCLLSMKCQSLFSGKSMKNISICYLLKFLPSMLSVNTIMRILFIYILHNGINFKITHTLVAIYWWPGLRTSCCLWDKQIFIFALISPRIHQLGSHTRSLPVLFSWNLVPCICYKK